MLPFTFTLIRHQHAGMMVPLHEVIEYLNAAATEAGTTDQAMPSPPAGLTAKVRTHPDIAIPTMIRFLRQETLRKAAGEFRKLGTESR